MNKQTVLTLTEQINYMKQTLERNPPNPVVCSAEQSILASLKKYAAMSAYMATTVDPSITPLAWIISNTQSNGQPRILHASDGWIVEVIKEVTNG